MVRASLAFHPFGSCSKARLSELVLRFKSVLFRGAGPTISDRFRGRPLSIMLADSDWCLLWQVPALCTESLISVFSTDEVSETLSFGVAVAGQFVGLSHGVGDALCWIGAEIGPETGAETGADIEVGNVEVIRTVVAADFGVVNGAESGVKGVLERGESSTLAERMGGSAGVLPDRNRLESVGRAKGGAAGCDVGITSGGRPFGESGCRTGL